MTEQIITYEFKNNLPIEFEIFDIANLYQHKRKIIINPHRAGFYHIIWVKKGYTEHTVDFNTIPLQENSLLFLNKDVIHSYSKEPYIGKSILFTEAFFSFTPLDTQFLKNSFSFNNPYNIATLELTPDLELVFNSLLTFMEQEVHKLKDHFTTDILKNYLQSFILNAEREFTKQNSQSTIKSADHQLIVLFRELLDMNFKT